jgi:hypothetical protein
MKTVRQMLTCALLAAAAWLTLSAALLLRAATGAVAALPQEIALTRGALIGEIAATRKDLAAQIAAARRDVLVRSQNEADALRTDLVSETDAIRATADRRLGDTLQRADAAVAVLDELRDDLKPTLDHSASITAQADASLPMFLDCEYNPDCVFNRYVGVSKGVEKAALNFGAMSQDVRGALPPMLKTWNQIGVDVSGTANNLNRLTKPKWYDRLIGYGLNGVIIYRNLNPVTSLTVTGARIISSR